MITEAELSAAARACGVGVRTLTDQLARWEKSPWHEQTVRAAAREAGYNKVSLEEILGQVKKNQAESFSRAELQDAASRLGASGAVAAVLAHLGGEFSALALMDAARAAGWKTRMEEVLAEARRLRQPSIANDDDVLTVRELSAALGRKWGYKGASLQHETDKIMEDIVRNREPEYPEGTVIEDAQGRQWKRRGEGWSRRNWSTDIFPLSEPRRPLKVMS